MTKKLNSTAKQFVAHLIEYFEKERDNGGPLVPLEAVRERVAQALKINLSTVSAVSMAVKNSEELKSPSRSFPRPKPISDVSNLNVDAIRNNIYEMYENRRHVTLASIHKRLHEKAIFHGSMVSLRTVLKEIGFKWQKDEPRRGLMEVPHVASKRIQFLRRYKDIKEEGVYQFVFLDETWIFQNGTIQRSWQDSNVRSVKTIKTDGKRHIVLHAGNDNGFIPGADLVFASKTSGDYHGEMNQTVFTDWFENRLLKNLSNPSVIVIDNAPYHNTQLEKIPNTSWKKGDIQNWLTNKRIIYEQNMLKSELLLKVSQNKPPKTYVIDQLAAQYGHCVLRLPPYHCIFNPIELIWGITKNYYNKNIGRDGRTIQDSLNMWNEAIKFVTPDMWKNSIKHTETEILQWYEREKMLDMQDILPIIINLAEDDESGESDFSNP